MNAFFTHPAWLLLLAPLAFMAWKRYRGAAVRIGASRPALRRLRQRSVLQFSTVLLLALAVAGMQLPAWTQRTRIVIAADVSPSIIDKSVQNQWLQGIAGQLDPARTEVAVVVFGATAGTERGLAPLPMPDEARAGRREGPRPAAHNNRPALPDLAQPATVVELNGTDIGAAIEHSRGLFLEGQGGARAIVVLSDFRDTRGRAASAASALAGSGIDLLAAPSTLAESGDVRVAALRVPDRCKLGRAVPIEVTIAAQSPGTVEVKVMRRRIAQPPLYIDSLKLKLEASDLQGSELRRTVRFVDSHAEGAGVETYVARVSRPEGEAAGDVTTNNQLAAAVRIDGTSTWAVLTRKGSTLEALCRGQKLGVDTRLFTCPDLPLHARDYAEYEGILVDGLSATELADAPLKALTEAVANGKGLVALGGELAFGAGGHLRDGLFERALPVYMTPEDDRTRTVLFLMDVSSSMDEKMGSAYGNVRKLDFAREQLAQALPRLKEQDRLGLVAFSGTARVAAPLSSDPRRESFLDALKKVQIEASTDMNAPLLAAREVLASDDAEEQLVMLLSDGKKTVDVPDETILKSARELCPPPAESGKPRRTTLYTFGIDVKRGASDPAGEALLKAIAKAGGGKYSPDFARLGEVVEQAFEQKKDFFVRREPFTAAVVLPHPVIGTEPFPVLAFRNRVKARAAAVTLLAAAPLASTPEGSPRKNHPDPLLVLSGAGWPGAARSAVLALSLDGPDGTALLQSPAGSRLLPAMLEWVEDRGGADGLNLIMETPGTDDLEITLRAFDPKTHAPLNGRRLQVLLTLLPQAGEIAPGKLQVPPDAAAPGIYRARIAAPAQGIYRAAIIENQRAIAERFVTIPYPAEYRRFGADRAAMTDLVAKAGGRSRVLNRPRDIGEWARGAEFSRAATPLAAALCAAALFCFLLEILLRHIRPSRT